MWDFFGRKKVMSNYLHSTPKISIVVVLKLLLDAINPEKTGPGEVGVGSILPEIIADPV